jgi:hypothetical protein
VNQSPIAEMPPRSNGAELVRQMRLHPGRAWLESRPQPIVLALAVCLGLSLYTPGGRRTLTTAELIDQILVAEWNRTNK